MELISNRNGGFYCQFSKTHFISLIALYNTKELAEMGITGATPSNLASMQRAGEDISKYTHKEYECMIFEGTPENFDGWEEWSWHSGYSENQIPLKYIDVPALFRAIIEEWKEACNS